MAATGLTGIQVSASLVKLDLVRGETRQAVRVLQYRHLISAPVDRTSANAWLYKTPCYDVKKIIQTHQCQM